MGFDLTQSGRRNANVEYQLDPQPQIVQNPAFDRPIGSPRMPSTAEFERAQANSFASVAGVGTSLLPVTDQVLGPRRQPFTFIIPADSVVTARAIIFRTISAPIAAIAAKISGHLLHQQTAEALIQRIRPQ